MMNALVLVILPMFVGGAILVGLLLLTRIMPGVPGKAKVQAEAISVPARGPEYVRYAAQRIAAYRRGLAVFGGLLVLTIIELVVGLNSGNLVPLFLLALAKAALIVNYFMHIRSVWAEEAH
jgi:cytochrome c oxidase subunit 4